MNIKEWALEDRPREKLSQKGAKHLTDAELLAIVLASGTRSLTALELAQSILSQANNSFDFLATQDVSTLCKIRGVGPAKAVTIKAVMELANRKTKHNVEKTRKITCSSDSYDELIGHFRDLQVEEFWVLYLNRNNRIIGKLRVGAGGVAGVVVDPKPIYKKAVNLMATGIVLAHNHPSGSKKPSNEDIKMTTKLKKAGLHFDIVVLDHLIIAGNEYYSFADEGMM